MWNKKTDPNTSVTIYEFQPNINFSLKQAKSDKIWYICNKYNNQSYPIDKPTMLEIQSEAFDYIISKFFEDIVKAVSAASGMLEVLDITLNNSLALGQKSVTIRNEGKSLEFHTDMLSAVLKQNSIDILLKSKIKNHLNDE